jgi:guanylate kinase
MIERGEFFEWAQVHGNRYGTSRLAIEAGCRPARTWCWRSTGKGALQIKQLFPHAVLIFILPPSWNELQQRLKRRGEDHPEVIASAWPTHAWRWPRPGTSTSL